MVIGEQKWQKSLTFKAPVSVDFKYLHKESLKNVVNSQFMVFLTLQIYKVWRTERDDHLTLLSLWLSTIASEIFEKLKSSLLGGEPCVSIRHCELPI